MDFHFLLRNGIAGGAFVFFLVAGIWVGDPAAAEKAVKALEEYKIVATAVLASTPVIGIAFQGVYLLFLQSRKQLFHDDARQWLASMIKALVRQSQSVPAAGKAAIEATESDPLFVMFYHSHAPVHLIEWARRRRSYHYLGWTLSMGAVVGLSAGAVPTAGSWSTLCQRLTTPEVLMLLVVIAGGVSLAMFLARKMLRDVEQMEAAWSLAHIHGDLADALGLAKPKK